MQPIDSLYQQVRQTLNQVIGAAAVSNGAEVITAEVPFRIVHGPDPRAFLVRIRRDELPRGINYAQFRREQEELECALGKPVGLYLEEDDIVITSPETERALSAVRCLVQVA